MRKRITIKQLEAQVEWINELTGSPLEPYTRGEDGKLRANIGNHHISQCYGGYCLHRMSNEHGGISCPVVHGHVPARELYNAMAAYINGLRDGKGV